MTENILEQSKILKDKIIDAINEFKSETQMLPIVDISIITRQDSHCLISTTIDVKVMVNL